MVERVWENHRLVTVTEEDHVPVSFTIHGYGAGYGRLTYKAQDREGLYAAVDEAIRAGAIEVTISVEPTKPCCASP